MVMPCFCLNRLHPGLPFSPKFCHFDCDCDCSSFDSTTFISSVWSFISLSFPCWSTLSYQQ
ncbi:hypothetical protein Bca52824_021958 [Brassica carinata]|uniref:Uncharacterized protein n=1 Tax=Brassica carinata TaxID=52824 RepID=A0A8X7VFQ6_BRACI|nr:hypothetical protein Bca52824_021958 [Brassica carinata]